MTGILPSSREIGPEDPSHAQEAWTPLLGAEVVYASGGEHPVTTLRPDSWRDHLARNGPRPLATGQGAHNLMARFDHALLSGRGGAHFAVSRKWRAHLESGGDGIVIANASESEPASAKDSALLHLRPHLVIDGIMLAAEAIGASKAVIWIHEDERLARTVLTSALAERPARQPSEPEIKIVAGPHRYLSGESSAIANALSGGPALPTFRRDPSERLRVRGDRALVHNVETLAQIALLARVAMADHRPSTLLTVTERDRRTVVEVSPSTSLAPVIMSVLGTRATRPPHAVLIGGYGGSWVSWGTLEGLTADDRVLSEHGFSMGAGILLPLLSGECGVQETAKIAEFMADASARQCGPCLYGLRSVADLLAEAAEPLRSKKALAKLDRFLGEIDGRGGCSHPDGVVRMVASAVRTFRADFDAHLTSGKCLHVARGA